MMVMSLSFIIYHFSFRAKPAPILVHPFFSFRKLEKTPSKMATDFLKSVLASFFSENELKLYLTDYQLFIIV